MNKLNDLYEAVKGLDGMDSNPFSSNLLITKSKLITFSCKFINTNLMINIEVFSNFDMINIF